MEKKYVVYVLTSSFEPMNYRYVGITSKTLCKRLYYHLYNSKKLNTYKDKWIQKNINNGYQILINSIREKLSEKEAKLLEIEYIRFYKEKGYKLTNATEGGDGCVGLSEEAKLKISLKNKGRKTMQGFKHSEEAIKKLKSYSHPHTKETKDNLSKFHFEKFKSDETNKKILDFFRKTPNSSNRKIAQHFNLPDYKISRVLITAKKHKYI